MQNQYLLFCVEKFSVIYRYESHWRLNIQMLRCWNISLLNHTKLNLLLKCKLCCCHIQRYFRFFFHFDFSSISNALFGLHFIPSAKNIHLFFIQWNNNAFNFNKKRLSIRLFVLCVCDMEIIWMKEHNVSRLCSVRATFMKNPEKFEFKNQGKNRELLEIASDIKNQTTIKNVWIK